MKKRRIGFIIFCLALCVSFGFSLPQEEDYYDYSFARLNYVKGDVFIQRAEDMGYEEGTVNLPVVEGDRLGTQDGRAEIHFGRKNYLRIDRYSQVDFAKLPQRGDDSISLHLFSGSVYLRINSISIEKEFQLHTPDGSFYILEEGLYRFEVKDNQETAVLVTEGSIEAAGEEGFEIVSSGQSLVAVDGLFTLGPDYIYATSEDAFTEWNMGRDAFHNRYVKTRYLPVEMNEYEAELDYYGRWVYERPYGYVWIPDVSDYSWRPYYYGRWAWYPVCGWTWCSYQPWGWCVSHYGRWHWRIGLGWYWIPTQRWGPAWVHWYHGVDYIGWSPLSYYNRPVVIVNNRFYGRNYGNDYPAHSRAFTVIRKDQLSARHVSRVALSPSGMSRLGKISLSSRQAAGRPAASRIGIKSSVASKALSRSNVRSIRKGYSPGNVVRQSAGKNIARPSRTVSRSRISSIRTYPSKNNSRLRTSPSGSRSASSRTGIKTYPSLRTPARKAQNSLTPRSRTSPSGLSRSTRSTIKRYSPSSTPRSPSYSSPNRSSPRIRSNSSRIRSSSSTGISPSRSNTSSATRRYSTRSRSSISSRLSGLRPTSRPTTRSAPSRSSSRIKSSSVRSRSSSPSRSSSSRSSSLSRAFRSTSRSRITRSAPSRRSSARSTSRSRSTGRVKKK
jgi:hypothetical protein